MQNVTTLSFTHQSAATAIVTSLGACATSFRKVKRSHCFSSFVSRWLFFRVRRRTSFSVALFSFLSSVLLLGSSSHVSFSSLYFADRLFYCWHQYSTSSLSSSTVSLLFRASTPALFSSALLTCARHLFPFFIALLNGFALYDTLIFSDGRWFALFQILEAVLLLSAQSQGLELPHLRCHPKTSLHRSEDKDND